MKSSRKDNNNNSITTKQRQTFGNMLHTSEQQEDQYSFRFSVTSENSPPDHHHKPPRPSISDASSPYNSAVFDQSPRYSTPSWDQTASPFLLPISPLSKSPWTNHMETNEIHPYTCLMGSLVREEGHIYSLATSGDFLYTGSDSRNIRVWKNQKEFSGFKSNSGLVKAIVIADERIFTGHQDGKIRVWKVSKKDPGQHKRIGTLPTFKAKVKSSFKPSNYVEARRNRSAIWIKHIDAISSLSFSEDNSLLYSASWDKTIKVWRVSDSKCLESILAHDDAVNSVVSGFDGLIFTGSADGTVKVWRREKQGKGTKHYFTRTLLKQECAVTSLAIDSFSTVLYCGSSDGLVNYWERDNLLSHSGVLRGHKLAVLCLATAGNLLFSGSADTNICVWRKDGPDHICLSVLSGHNGPVKCLAVEEDKGNISRAKRHVLFSGSLDKSVKIWNVNPDSVVMQKQLSFGSPHQHAIGEADNCGHNNASKVSSMRTY